MIDVLVVDDHPVVRSGLTGMVASEADLRVVAAARDGGEAVDRYVELRPDVVLMDLRMPSVDGTEATRRIIATDPEAHVLVLTTYDDDAEIVRAVEAGAAGYVLKDAPLTDLVAAIRAVARGETVIAAPVAARLVSRLRRPAATTITPREQEVLAAVARGGTNAAIGRQLFISEATVKTHLLRIFAKLEVEDRTHAVTVAYERGLLPPPATH